MQVSAPRARYPAMTATMYVPLIPLSGKLGEDCDGIVLLLAFAELK
jgi:hypothetical protein